MVTEAMKKAGILKEKFQFDQKEKSVLIVDDSLLFISKLIELLRDEALANSVEYCSSYTEGIELLRRFVPEVALLDINLPGKSGIELLQHIKRAHPATIVIMVSNETSEHHQRLCFKQGASYFIDKSKDFEKIPSIISALS